MKTQLIMLIAVIAGTSFAHADIKSFEYPLKSDASSTTLKIEGINREISITGTNESVIRIEVDSFLPVPEKAKGLRSLLSDGNDNTGIGLELTPAENDPNTLILKQVRREFGENIRIFVPKTKALNVKVDAHMNQGVSVSGVSGEVVVNTLNGGISLDAVTGPVVLNTVNGEIKVKISDLNNALTSSITTVNGQVELWLNATEKVTFDLSVMHGEIYTDLDIQSDAKERQDGLYPMVGARQIHGKLNGGGTAFSISTINGEIYLRKTE